MRPRYFLMLAAFVVVLLMSASLTQAQPGGGKKDKKGGPGGKGSNESATEFVTRMMAFNKAKDGKLTKEELTDSRLHFLFERADTNKDGVVTREELEALYTRESTQDTGKGDKGDKGGFGKGDKGGFGKGDKGGFGKGKGPPLGTVLPEFVQDALSLTDSQRKDLADLQKDVDSRLEKILNEDQRKMLRDMRNFGGGPGFGEKKKGDKKGPPPGN